MSYDHMDLLDPTAFRSTDIVAYSTVNLLYPRAVAAEMIEDVPVLGNASSFCLQPCLGTWLSGWNHVLQLGANGPRDSSER